MRLARAVPSRVAGTNVHWRTATMAASSRSPPPEVTTSTFETWPSTSTVTASTTSACLRSVSAVGGYTASTCVSTTGRFDVARCPRELGRREQQRNEKNREPRLAVTMKQWAMAHGCFSLRHSAAKCCGSCRAKRLWLWRRAIDPARLSARALAPHDRASVYRAMLG